VQVIDVDGKLPAQPGVETLLTALPHYKLSEAKDWVRYRRIDPPVRSELWQRLSDLHPRRRMELRDVGTGGSRKGELGL
jgi:hypothetical protein